MRPILTVEFHAKDRGVEFEEESVTLHSPEELFKFVAPGGGCETIPDEVGEIRMVFVPCRKFCFNSFISFSLSVK